MIPQHPPAAPLAAPASWGSRAKAFALDSLLLLVPALLLFVVFVAPALGADTDPDEGNLGLFFGLTAFLVCMLVVGVIWALHVVLMMIRKGERNGQTWGKQLAGIRAVRDNGERWGFGSAALREVVLKMLVAVLIPSLALPVIPGLVNFLWPLWDDQNRTLHDMAVSSHVVRA